MNNRPGSEMNGGVVVVVGMGEVGQPLLRILNRKFECIPVDLEPVEIDRPCDVLHICFPFQIGDFVGTTAGYMQKYNPALTVVHSTIAPGTTRKIHEMVKNRPLVYSPVRGKHARMESDMLRYRKFVAGFDSHAVQLALRHFQDAGFETECFRTPDIAELSKLLETTYFGVLIGWAQEVERLAAEFGGSFDDVNSFVKEIDFLPSHIFPGLIGGHCVMPNIAILQERFSSKFLDAIVASNKSKAEQMELTLIGEPAAND